MKFVFSVVCGFCTVVLLILFVGFFLRCEHDNKIELFSFSPGGSVGNSYFKIKCDDCDQSFGYSLFSGSPTNTSYITTVEQHIENNSFAAGEYHTVRATVLSHDYDSTKTYIYCEIRDEDVVVRFYADFKEKYEQGLELFEIGDKITFRGKSSDKGFYWTDCEIITK
jgi:hypothetical protein